MAAGDEVFDRRPIDTINAQSFRCKNLPLTIGCHRKVIGLQARSRFVQYAACARLRSKWN